MTVAYAQTETIPHERTDAPARASSSRLATRIAYCVFALSFGFASAVVFGLIP